MKNIPNKPVHKSGYFPGCFPDPSRSFQDAAFSACCTPVVPQDARGTPRCPGYFPECFPGLDGVLPGCFPAPLPFSAFWVTWATTFMYPFIFVGYGFFFNPHIYGTFYLVPMLFVRSLSGSFFFHNASSHHTNTCHTHTHFGFEIKMSRDFLKSELCALRGGPSNTYLRISVCVHVRAPPFEHP